MSFAGFAVAIASLCSNVLLFLIELSGNTNTAYLGIFAYVLLPSGLILGLVVIGAGMLVERRRRRKLSPAEIAAFPKIDFNNPNSRRAFFTFIGLSMIFVFMSAFGSYRAFEHTESVAFCGTTCHETMKPEYVAFQVSSHARLRCVDCHVGSGAEWYARSKITGAYQLYAVAFNKVPKPITTPVHNMRPARDTCEQCHWPAKFYGNQFKNLTHYAYNEENTARTIRMLVNVGGGDPATGPVAGIHWHMNIANEITYISTDDHRQVIPWVQSKDRQGNITQYYDRSRPLSSEQIAAASKRRMDCVDCHNRLVINAVEAIEGEGQVTVSIRRAESDSEAEFDEEAVIEVSDNGCGVSEENLARIFHPFFTTTKGGTGLGLPAVRRIARAHGGRVEVDSTVGIGTTFSI